MKNAVMIETNTGGKGKLLTAYVEMQSGEHKAFGAQHIKTITTRQTFEVGDQVRLKPGVLDCITSQAKRRGVVLDVCGDWAEVQLEDVGEGALRIGSKWLELMKPEPPFAKDQWVMTKDGQYVGQVRIPGGDSTWVVLKPEHNEGARFTVVVEFWNNRLKPYDHQFEEGQLVMVLEEQTVPGGAKLLWKGDVGRVVDFDAERTNVLIDSTGLNNPKVCQDGRWFIRRTNLVRYVPQYEERTTRVDARTGLTAE